MPITSLTPRETTAVLMQQTFQDLAPKFGLEMNWQYAKLLARTLTNSLEGRIEHSSFIPTEFVIYALQSINRTHVIVGNWIYETLSQRFSLDDTLLLLARESWVLSKEQIQRLERLFDRDSADPIRFINTLSELDFEEMNYLASIFMQRIPAFK